MDDCKHLSPKEWFNPSQEASPVPRGSVDGPAPFQEVTCKCIQGCSAEKHNEMCCLRDFSGTGGHSYQNSVKTKTKQIKTEPTVEECVY